MSSKSRKKPSQKQVSFSMWLSGTRWGLKSTLGIIISLTAVFVFIKLSNDLGLTRYLLAHRGYVDDQIDTAQAPLRNGITNVQVQLATGRLNEIEKQLLDNQISQFKVRGTPAEVPLTAQAEKLKRERDDIVRLMETLNPTPGRR